jgi:hypothetical protein
VFSAPQRRRCLSLMPPLTSVFGDDNIREGATAVVGQGGLTIGRRGQGWARTPWWWAHLIAPLASSFWLLSSCDIIWISGYFSRIIDIHKYGILTALFPVESWLRQQILQWSSNM